jgi:hypothetical protein
MSDQPILRFVHQTESVNGDCTVASLAMALGISYSQALVLIARVQPDVLKKGAHWSELKRAAKLHRPQGGAAVVLRERRKFSLDEDSDDAGILGVEWSDGKQHAVYLKRGLVFDGASGNVWDVDVYLKANNARPLTLLVRE